MEFDDEAYVLGARPFGETAAIVEVLTAEHGRWAAHVAGGASRRMKPILQPGARVRFAYRARGSDSLGGARLEADGAGAAGLFDDALALSALTAATAVVSGALPEREPHAAVFYAFEALCAVLDVPDIWPAVLVRFEMGLLQEMGFGLDLTRCAVTGSTEDLVWVSPRTGRAVSASAGAPWADRLLPLPPFLLGAQAGLSHGDIGKGLALTGRFLQDFVFSPLNRPLPPARDRLLQRLEESGRL